MRIVPDDTKIDFFRFPAVFLGVSGLLAIVTVISLFVQGLNYGIDFLGGTTIRTEAATPVDVAAYRTALDPLALGDVSITEIFDPTFADDENVAMIRIQAQPGAESVPAETVEAVRVALVELDPSLRFAAVESVGPKVSGELIQSAGIAIGLSMLGILIYIWLRFEWQFALASVLALIHDVFLTIGVFSLLQIRFDLAIIAALLTIVGYSINDTVVIFDRVRENLRRYKKTDLKDVLNLSINETLSRTFMTSGTTLLALIALFVLGGDVIRGFVFAIIWGVVIGTYSTVYVATAALLKLGVERDDEDKSKAGTQFADVDA
ncbi:protein translocase subunit SecF [Halovulum dunhuangense]|uniref:Protein-export membrane protein SecF n=1 Tax=Halovulum dunhuangense TaxID=1505036 RepID=A0A849L720_9RHOB|nr:protein translocase subunit SecF [Halovulum dunhuangense]NNU81867.1 protein translocase subunit SecF [Halovulum dunhuangense]